MLNLLFYEPCSDEVAEGFGSIPVARAFDKPVKPLEEISINGNSESGKAGHRNTFF
jgi:hypothetical protein